MSNPIFGAMQAMHQQDMANQALNLQGQNSRNQATINNMAHDYQNEINKLSSENYRLSEYIKNLKIGIIKEDTKDFLEKIELMGHWIDTNEALNNTKAKVTKQIEDYNGLVDEFNTLLQSKKDLVAKYNTLLETKQNLSAQCTANIAEKTALLDTIAKKDATIQKQLKEIGALRGDIKALEVKVNNAFDDGVKEMTKEMMRVATDEGILLRSVIRVYHSEVNRLRELLASKSVIEPEFKWPEDGLESEVFFPLELNE